MRKSTGDGMTATGTIRRCCRQAARLALGLLPLAAAYPVLGADDGAADLDEIVVTSHRRAQNVFAHAGNIERLGHEELARIRHQHLHELLNRVSGV